MVDVRDRTGEYLVLRARNYREQDRLLTVAGPESGPEAVIARGARKPGHALSACAQPFCRATLTLSPPKGGVSFLKEGRQEESFLPPGGDVARFAYLSYFSELLLAGWPENRPEPGLYALARAAFVMLALGDDPERTARCFELRFLDQLGLLPPLSACAVCGRLPGSGDGRSFRLSPRRGQLLCAACCAEQGEGGPLLSPGAVMLLERLRSLPLARVSQLRLSPGQNRELEQALDPFLRYHLDYAGRAKDILRQLL